MVVIFLQVGIAKLYYFILADNRETPFNCTFNCTLTSSSGLIWALCSYPESSFAAGIQVIVQSTNVSEVHKLYVNQSMDLDTPVTVPVERDGEYQVSIFAIREGMGILGPTGQYYSNFVMVSATDVPSVATTAQGDVSTSARPQSESSTTGKYFFNLKYVN